MYSWLVHKVTRFAFAQLNAGNPRWILRLLADDVHFRFPGQHSWAADYRSKEQVRPWLARYVRVGLQLEPHEILVSGPPWNTTVCIHFTDRATNANGDVVYSNEGVLFDKMVWGRAKVHVAYEDTQKIAVFDEYLAANEPIQT